MTIERAGMDLVSKPWGSTVLKPWSAVDQADARIGEIWFKRPDSHAPLPALLLKLLFTEEALSIQVHPDDAFARSIGLDHGKSEAWYILSARAGAQVAIGLKRQLSAIELRSAIDDGSIAELVQWRPALLGDVISVPAGTIHTIGPGLVIAEIQQRSDATFRLFDYGRHRELQPKNAAAVAHAGPADRQASPIRLTQARTLLVASPHFVLERVEFPPGSHWRLEAPQETWVLVLDGEGLVGLSRARIGEAVFLERDRADITVGPKGMKGLIAYVASESAPGLLRSLDDQGAVLMAGPAEHAVDVAADSISADECLD